jgi:hypothetical protein
MNNRWDLVKATMNLTFSRKVGNFLLSESPQGSQEGLCSMGYLFIYSFIHTHENKFFFFT